MPLPSRGAFLALLCAGVTLRAEDPALPTAPQVWETDLCDWDAAALKEGDWVEYELSSPSVTAAPGKRPARRFACVGLDGETAWVEVTEKNAGPAKDGMVLALGVSRETGRVTAAFWGRAGGRAIPVKPTAGAPGMPGGPLVTRPSVAGTGTVSREKVKSGAALLDCEKIELRTELTSSCCNEKSRTTLWVSDKVPFPALVGERPLVKGVAAEIEWTGKPTVRGGLVRKSVFRNNATETMTLLRHGRDAAVTLSRP